MIRGNVLEVQIYEPSHIDEVWAEIERNFTHYFSNFSSSSLDEVFRDGIYEYRKEQEAYRAYLDLDSLEEYDSDPNAFKTYSRKYCPIIRRCLNSQDEVMKSYKQSFNAISGRELLNAVRRIAEFGLNYVTEFDDQSHEAATSLVDLDLDQLNDPIYGAAGVIGYGIQSSLLYGLYCRQFAHRSQGAIWTLYFLSNRKDFGLDDGSEFLMVHADQGTIEPNYLYPAHLFGFYSLRIFRMLRAECKTHGIDLIDAYRYIYLNAFCNYVADSHREDIMTYKRSSEYVESQPWF